MLSLMSNEIQKNVRDKVSLKEEMYMKHDTEFLTHPCGVNIQASDRFLVQHS